MKCENSVLGTSLSLGRILTDSIQTRNHPKFRLLECCPGCPVGVFFSAWHWYSPVQKFPRKWPRKKTKKINHLPLLFSKRAADTGAKWMEWVGRLDTVLPNS